LTTWSSRDPTARQRPQLCVVMNDRHRHSDYPCDCGDDRQQHRDQISIFRALEDVRCTPICPRCSTSRVRR
jgi:hypothetical protein